MIDATVSATITGKRLLYADVVIKDAPREPQVNSESQVVGIYLFRSIRYNALPLRETRKQLDERGQRGGRKLHVVTKMP